VFSPAFTLGVSYNTNDYSIEQRTFGSLDISGETEQAAVYGRYSFKRSRNANLYATTSFNRKKADVESQGQTLGEDDLSVLHVELGFDSLDSRWGGGINRGALSISEGLDDFMGSMDSEGDGQSLRIVNPDGTRTGGNFTKVAFRLTRLQSVSNNHALLLRLSGQHSDDALTSLEQFSLGGPNSVRAYPVSEYVRDTALFSSIEWVMNAPGFADQAAFAGRNWGEVLKISLFADYAQGELNQSQGISDKDIAISGAGISFDLRLSGTFFARLDIATPLGKRDASNGDNPQIWASAGYQF
jgi:hemolysin activation/secretion protein